MGSFDLKLNEIKLKTQCGNPKLEVYSPFMKDFWTVASNTGHSLPGR